DDLADVLDETRGDALGLFDVPHGGADDGLVGVADDGDDTVVFLGEAADMAHTTAADAGDGDAEAVIGGAGRGGPAGRGGAFRQAGAGQGGQQGRVLEEGASADRGHRDLLLGRRAGTGGNLFPL